MKYFNKGCVLILVVTLFAAALRIPRLSSRPMHCDEAVHACKLGELLEKGEYHYDPYDYHGPTLNYFTLIPAALCSIHTCAGLNEFTLRIVPVFFGLLLIVLLLFLTDSIKLPMLICSAILLAVSPAFVFYSRYYIQEMLLVCFTFGFIIFTYRYICSSRFIWILFAGIFLGLMHATKETFIINLAAALVAFTLASFDFRSVPRFFKAFKPFHLLAALVVAAFVSILFFSSFFTNFHGVIDSIRTYLTYFHRADNGNVHIYPWYYYLKLLIYHKLPAGPLFSEAFIIFFALVGLFFVARNKIVAGIDSYFIRFIALYTILLAAFYSLIPYKTPWCLLSFHNGLILLAAFGIVSLINLAATDCIKNVIISIFILGCFHLLWQSCLQNYEYYADPANPYVYAHTSTDIFDIVNRANEIAKVSPDGNSTRIDVICTKNDYWPLPWYFRNLTNVAYLNAVPKDLSPTPLIIASPDLQSAIIQKLYEFPPPGQRDLYVPLFDATSSQLRPGVELVGLVKKDLWDKFVQNKSAANISGQTK